jgi:hypothetical protein
VSDLTVSDVDSVSEVVYLSLILSGGSSATISQMNIVVVMREVMISCCGPSIQLSLMSIEMSFNVMISSEVLLSPFSSSRISAVDAAVIVVCIRLNHVSLVLNCLSVMADHVVSMIVLVQVLVSMAVVMVVVTVAILDQCLVSL